MLHIALCGKSRPRQDSLAALSRKYLALRPQLHGRVSVFPDFDALQKHGKDATLCILDAGEGEEGLETGRLLHEIMPDAAIIFYTQKQDPAQAISAYRLHAVQYLSSPVQEKLFFDAIDKAAALSGQDFSPREPFNSVDGLVNVQLSHVVYAKSSGHRITLFLKDGRTLESKCLRVSFGDVLRPFFEDGFLRCHDSYAVNLGCPWQLTPEGVQLQNGVHVPVSIKKRPVVREALRYSV